jgi:hypothetical protein
MLRKLGFSFLTIILGLYITVQMIDVLTTGNVVQGANVGDDLVHYSDANETMASQFNKGKISKKINDVLKEKGLAEEAECAILGTEHYFMVEAKIRPAINEENDRKEVLALINELLRVNGYQENSYNIYIKD